MTDSDKKRKMDEMLELVKAIRFNHDIPENEPVRAIVNSGTELKNYCERMAQINLPRRFFMPKTQTRNVDVKDADIEIEEPETQLDSTYSPGENHKTRSIFG